MMSTDKKIKVYKNPARTSPENAVKQYVPQYQLMGVNPSEYKSPIPAGTQVKQAPPSTDNPRAPRAAVRQPYAETVTSPIGRGKGALPNVGNNMEQTWSGVDSDIIDDISGIDVEAPMVDNNEFVSAAAFGLPEETELEVQSQDSPKSFLTKEELDAAILSDSIVDIIRGLEEDEYLLLVHSDVVCSGDLSDVQEQARLIIFGEHESYGNPVSIDDIVVIKRTKIKMGVFLE